MGNSWEIDGNSCFFGNMNYQELAMNYSWIDLFEIRFIREIRRWSAGPPALKRGTPAGVLPIGVLPEAKKNPWNPWNLCDNKLMKNSWGINGNSCFFGNMNYQELAMNWPWIDYSEIRFIREIRRY